MSKIYTVDGGNVSRLVKKIYAVDGGNVSRQVKKVWVVDGGGVSRLVYTSAHSFSITAGQFNNGDGTFDKGYSANNFVIGSITNAVDPNGRTIKEFYDVTAGTGLLQLWGFPSDPGINYIKDITANSVTRVPFTYTWIGGVNGIANWGFNNFGFVNLSTYPAILTYN
ncbi:MAG TPA: hypothetical protein VFA39_15595 [Steroidobacteraceae bacterium]|nr:hypothetical protein [Steroidobacteraceae bacterium]